MKSTPVINALWIGICSNLLESLLVHEDEVATFLVEILVGAVFYTHVFQFLADVEAAFNHVSVDNVLELCAHERIALSRLYV